MKDDTKQNERKKQISSPDDAGAYTFHPVTHSNIDKPTRNRPHCRVLLLDGQYHIVPVDKKAKAVVVLNELFRHLELKDLQEKEFFSVYYVDISGSRIFLNPFKQIRRQLPNATSRTTWDLFFGVQFYATELGMLADEMTRYLYVLQMCRDIKEKRINADHATKLKLVSLLVQANCGDYDPQEHKSDYVEPYIDMIYNPADIPIGLLNSVHEVHKEKTGLKPNEADDDFFMTANSLYKFGQQIFPVHDRLNQSCEVGASIVGLFFHKDGKEFMNIPWGHVVTVGYRNKKIRIRYHPKGSDDHVEEWLYLYCSRPNAKLVWRGCVEQHTFFRLERPTPLVKNATKSYHSFNRNSELRFSRGRTLYQMLRSEHKQSSGFQRSLSFHFEKKPARDPSTSIQEEEPKPAPKPDKSPTPSPSPGEPEPDDISNGRRPSIESETLQDKIEKALSEKHLDNTDSDQTETDNINVTVHVEINHSGGEEDKSDGEGEQKQNDSTSMESDVPALDDQNDNTNLKIMKVEITKSNPDLTNVVEFSGAEKNNSSFMVTLEETSPSPPPDNLKDRIMFEGNYRSDSIITNDFGPVAQYLLEKSNLEDGTVTATAVDIEVRTPTPTYDETKTEFMEQELIKVSHVETNLANDIEVSIDIKTENF